MSKSSNTNRTSGAADTCANGHRATNGQCSVGWCAYNKWPHTWPENRARR